MDATQNLSISKKGMTGSTLKLIAIISMLIDHIGATILLRLLVVYGIAGNEGLYNTYTIFRLIGRIAFPIFCFLVVEGFLHTRNVKKYLGRMLLLAFISEIPFDLAFYDTPFAWVHQNVFFTLFLGLLAIWGIKVIEDQKQWSIFKRAIIGFLAVAGCVAGATLLKTDYYLLGVIIIVIIYLFRKTKTLAVGIGCAALMTPTAFFALIPVHFYNYKRGLSLKWVFYLFYPVHLIVLYLIVLAMGLGGVLG